MAAVAGDEAGSRGGKSVDTERASSIAKFRSDLLLLLRANEKMFGSDLASPLYKASYYTIHHRVVATIMALLVILFAALLIGVSLRFVQA